MNDLALTITSIFTLLCASIVVFSKNAIYSAFGLILALFGLAVMYLLWGTPFMAMIQVLIYTGAIVVLFVFVVMLLNLSPTSMNLSFNFLTILMIVASSWFVALLLLKSLNQGVLPLSQAVTTFDMKTVSKLLFTKYVWPFEVLSIFLLALIVAVFTLARPENIEDNL